MTNRLLHIATRWILCFNPYKCKGKSEIAKRGTLVRFAHDCAHCARRIRLKIWPTVHHLLLHIVTFMLQPSKMQGEARNPKKRLFGALRARLCALRARDQLENLTNCPLLIATHGDFYASTLKNARGSQKLRKEPFWHASRAIVHAACAESAWKFDQLSSTYCYT